MQPILIRVRERERELWQPVKAFNRIKENMESMTERMQEIYRLKIKRIEIIRFNTVYYSYSCYF